MEFNAIAIIEMAKILEDYIKTIGNILDNIEDELGRNITTKEIKTVEKMFKKANDEIFARVKDARR